MKISSIFLFLNHHHQVNKNQNLHTALIFYGAAKKKEQYPIAKKICHRNFNKYQYFKN